MKTDFKPVFLNRFRNQFSKLVWQTAFVKLVSNQFYMKTDFKPVLEWGSKPVSEIGFENYFYKTGFKPVSHEN
jgi:hypothetical protein